MKATVIVPPTINTETIWTKPAGIYDRRDIIDRVFNWNKHKIQYERASGHAYRGRTTFSDCVVKFDDEYKVNLDNKIEEIDTDEYTLFGVFPIEFLSDNTVLCKIDYFKYKGEHNANEKTYVSVRSF